MHVLTMHKVYIPRLFECAILLNAILHDGMFAYLLRLTKFTLIAEQAEALSCKVLNRSYIRHGYPISSADFRVQIHSRNVWCPPFQ